MPSVLHLSPAADGWRATAERLRAAHRDSAVGAVLLDAGSGLAAPGAELDAAAAALRTLATLPLPAVAALDGPADASALALALACPCAFAGPAWEVEPETRALLALGVPWALSARLGAGRAEALLLGAPPLTSARLTAAGIAEPRADAPAAAAERAEALAADPRAALLLRSLRAGARGDRAQAAAFDRELIALIDEGDDDDAR